jgi:hypothetical protein
MYRKSRLYRSSRFCEFLEIEMDIARAGKLEIQIALYHDGFVDSLNENTLGLALQEQSISKND